MFEVPPVVLRSDELLSFWNSRLPEASDLRAGGTKAVIIDRSAFLWLLARWPAAGRSLRRLRRQLRAGSKRTVIRPEPERVRGPEIEIFEL